MTTLDPNAAEDTLSGHVCSGLCGDGWHAPGVDGWSPLSADDPAEDTPPAITIIEGEPDEPPCGDYPAPCNCDDPVTHGGH